MRASVADPDPTESEPFWSDPDSIKPPDPDPTKKCYNTKHKFNKSIRYFLETSHFLR